MIGLMIAICGTAFVIGLIAGAIVNYVALVKWRREQEGWYRTWHRH